MPTLSFTFLELLDRSFRVYRENFGTFVGLSALVIIPITLITGLISYATADEILRTQRFGTAGRNADPGLLCLVSLVPAILSLVQAVLINGLLTYMTSEYLFGRRVTIGEAYEAVKHRFSTLGCGFLLLGIVLVALTIPILLVGAACFPVWAGIGLVFYVYIATYSFLAPVIVLENVDTSFGVNRAWSLGKSRFWQALGVTLAVGILGFIFGLIFGLLAGFVAQGLVNSRNPLAADVINLVFTTFINIFLIPLTPVALTLLYYDGRSKAEGLDLALAALDNPQARPIHIASPRPESFLSSRDLVNVLALVGIAFVLAVVGGATFAALIDQFAPALRNLR
jgi:hypothetical protein